jgi:type II secretory pathway component PulC
LGTFLQRLEVDEQPVLLAGKFRGFRITALRGADFWSGVDLMSGDVVTAVNGFPIERPEQAQTAFDSLVVASELRVAYDRGGQERELVYSIVDDR